MEVEVQSHGLSVSGRTFAHAPPLGLPRLSRMPQGSGVSPSQIRTFLGVRRKGEHPSLVSHWTLGDEEFFFFRRRLTCFHGSTTPLYNLAGHFLRIRANHILPLSL